MGLGDEHQVAPHDARSGHLPQGDERLVHIGWEAAPQIVFRRVPEDADQKRKVQHIDGDTVDLPAQLSIKTGDFELQANWSEMDARLKAGRFSQSIIEFFSSDMTSAWRTGRASQELSRLATAAHLYRAQNPDSIAEEAAAHLVCIGRAPPGTEATEIPQAVGTPTQGAARVASAASAGGGAPAAVASGSGAPVGRDAPPPPPPPADEDGALEEVEMRTT